MLWVLQARVRCVWPCVLVALATSCKHDRLSTGGSGAGGAQGSVPAVTSSSAGAPAVVGGTAAALHAYLANVDTVQGATFDVSWRPDVVRLDRATTLRALQGVSPDGSTFAFAASEPAIASIKPGSVLLVWGVALRRVVSATPDGDAVIVRTTVAPLTDAIDHGHIAFQGPADFAHGLVTPTFLKVDSVRVSLGPSAPGGLRWLPATYVHASGSTPPPNDDQSGSGPDQSSSGSDNTDNGDNGGTSADATANAIPQAANQVMKGEAFGMEYEVGYLYSAGGLDFELEASKKAGEAGSATSMDSKDNKQIIQGLKNQEAHTPDVPAPAQGNPDPNPLATAIKASMNANKAWSSAKNNWDRQHQDVPSAVWASLPELTSDKLWSTVNNQLDLRIKAQGHIDGLNLNGDINIANAKQIASQFKIDNLNGLVNLQYIVRLGTQQPNWAEQLKAMLPVSFNIPLVIGGIPFMFQVAVNLYAVPGLSGHYATAQGTAHLNVAGNAGLQVGTGNLSASGQYEGAGFMVDDDNNMSSLGVSAILVSVEFPRLGFGVGLFNSYSIAFIDFVGTSSIVAEGSMGLMPCTRMQVDAAVGAGVATQVMGLPSIIANQVNAKLSKRLPDLWHYEKITYKPKELNCAMKKGQ